MPYIVVWTERKVSTDYDSHYGIGPHLHNRFSRSFIVSQAEKDITFGKAVSDLATAEDCRNHIGSWYGNFNVQISKMTQSDFKEFEKSHEKLTRADES